MTCTRAPHRRGVAQLGLHTDPSGQNVKATLPLEAVVQGHVTLLKVDTEGFEDYVFKDTKAVFGRMTVDNALVEVKGYNSLEKRQLLQRIFEDGGFKHVYNYQVCVGASLRGGAGPGPLQDLVCACAPNTQDAIARAIRRQQAQLGSAGLFVQPATRKCIPYHVSLTYHQRVCANCVLRGAATARACLPADLPFDRSSTARAVMARPRLPTTTDGCSWATYSGTSRPR